MTTWGRWLCIAAVALLALGLGVGSVPAVVIGIGLVVIVAAAVGFVVRPVQLEVARDIQPDRVSRDGDALAYFSITNTGSLAVPATVAEQRFGDLDVRVVLPRLRRHQQVVRTLRLPTDRRGIFAIGPLEARRADPFRIVQRVWSYGGNDELWVYPRVLPLRSLAPGLSRPQEGPTLDTAPQGSITFHRIREYVQGDDLRMIHWKSTARTGTLMVRHNIDTSQPFSVVVVNVEPGVHTAASFEVAMDAAASAVVACGHDRAPVQLRLTSGERFGGPTARESQPLLDALTALEPSAGRGLQSELLALQREKGGTSVVVVTGTVDNTVVALAGRLRRRFQRIVVVEVQDAADGDGNARVWHPVAGVSVLTTCDSDGLTASWNQVALR